MKHITIMSELANGAKVLFIDVPGVKTFDLSIGINAGYRFAARDDQMLYELPHVLEHAVFDGSKVYKTTDELHAVFDANGGSWNGVTNGFNNMFMFHNRVKNAKSVIAAALDCVFFPLLSDQTVEEEIVTIQNELEPMMSDFGFNAAAFSQQLITPDYATSVDSQLNRLVNITPESVRNYHKKYYTAHNTRIVVCVDLAACSQKTIETCILRAMKDVKPGRREKVPRFDVDSADPSSVHSEKINKDVEQSTASVVFFKPDVSDVTSMDELGLFCSMATGIKTYSVNHILRKKGMIYGLDFVAMQGIEGQSLELQLSAINDKFAEVYANTLEQLRLFAENGVSATQFKTALQEYVDSTDDVEDSADSLMGWYMFEFMIDEPIRSPREYKKTVKQITQESMLATVRGVMRFDQLFMSVFSAKPVRATTTMSLLAREILDRKKPVTQTLIEENSFTLSSRDTRYKWCVGILSSVFIGLTVMPLIVPSWLKATNIANTVFGNNFIYFAIIVGVYLLLLLPILLFLGGNQLRKGVWQVVTSFAAVWMIWVFVDFDKVVSVFSSQGVEKMHAYASVLVLLALVGSVNGVYLRQLYYARKQAQKKAK